MEADIGSVGIEEDGVDNSGKDHRKRYTTPLSLRQLLFGLTSAHIHLLDHTLSSKAIRASRSGFSTRRYPTAGMERRTMKSPKPSLPTLEDLDRWEKWTLRFTFLLVTVVACVRFLIFVIQH